MFLCTVSIQVHLATSAWVEPVTACADRSRSLRSLRFTARLMETADAETGTLTACYNGRKNKPRDSTVRAKPIAHHCETDGSTAAPAVTLWVGRHDPGGHSPMRER